MQLSLDYRDVCKAAVGGNYEGEYFKHSSEQPTTNRRLRAVVQYMNSRFSDNLRTKGHKYHIKLSEGPESTESPAEAAPEDNANENNPSQSSEIQRSLPSLGANRPTRLSNPEALNWVREALTRTRGKELTGNFNPLLIGELFWEQSSKWRRLALDHLESVADQCSRFVRFLLQQKCPKDIHSRLWSYQIQDALKSRSEAAVQELDRIMEDIENYPINYNHYYTDTTQRYRQARVRATLAECIKSATTHTSHEDCDADHTSTTINVDQVVGKYSERIDPDMEKLSCKEALDCLLAIYKASLNPLKFLLSR